MFDKQFENITDTMASAFPLLQQSMQCPRPSPFLPYSGASSASANGYNYHYLPYSQSPLPNHAPPTSPSGVYPPVPGYTTANSVNDSLVSPDERKLLS